jgi:hypothetical protein
MKKEQIITLFLIIIFVTFSKIIYAQPGWHDYSKKISFEVKDETDSIITFKNNNAYSIIFEDSIYTDKNIPTNDFIPTRINGHTFSYQITINDCKIQVPIKNYYDRNTPLQISIVHEKDTMHLLDAENIQLKFEKGYFYFPSWASILLSKKGGFETTGNTSIKHLHNQSFFIVPKNVFFDSSNFNYKNYRELNAADSFVEKNYLDKNIKYIHNTEKITQLNQLPYFKHLSTSDVFYPTDKPNKFIGKLEYTYDEGNTYYSKAFFSILDKEKLTLKHWQVNSNIFSYYNGKLWIDSFSKKIYTIVGIRNELYNRNKSSDYEKYPIKNSYYESNNYGETWQQSTQMNNLVKYQFRELELLDDHYAVGYRRDEQEKHQKLLGRYYLIKDNKVIDSLITPDDVYYNSNYNNYHLYKINKTLVNLGPWKFIVLKDSIGSNSAYQTFLKTLYNDKKQYANIYIKDNYLLAVRKTNGTINVSGGYDRILENGENIFIFLNYGILVSFNTGEQFTYLPIKIDVYNRSAALVDIDKDSNIDFYQLGSLEKHRVRFEPLGF